MRTPESPFQRLVRSFGALLLACLLSATAAHAAGRWATLEAIHHLENPRNLTRPGPFGELGAYQFRVTTWQLHTKIPFSQALDRRTSDIVAVQHYEWLKERLVAAGKPATPYNIALAWNGGINAAISGRAPRVAHSYAQRAVNLATVFEKAKTPPAEKPLIVASIR